MSYTKEEIDQIILSKDLDEFYFAIFEKKRKFKLISDQELKELRGENVKYIGASKEKVDTVYEKETVRNKEKTACRRVSGCAGAARTVSEGWVFRRKRI